MIGVGFRSHEHMGNFLQREDVEIIAFADPQQRSIDEALKEYKKYRKNEPAIYKNGNEDYKNLLKISQRKLIKNNCRCHLNTIIQKH